MEVSKSRHRVLRCAVDPTFTFAQALVDRSPHVTEPLGDASVPAGGEAWLLGYAWRAVANKYLNYPSSLELAPQSIPWQANKNRFSRKKGRGPTCIPGKDRFHREHLFHSQLVFY